MKPILSLCLGAAVLAGCASHGASSVIPSSGGDSSGASLAGIQNTRALSGFKTGVPQDSLGTVRFVVSLPLRNEAELDRTIAAISDPDSPQYRHFLTPEAFLERYAPLASDLAAVAADLQRSGFNVSVTDQAVLAGGSQAQVERYFHTTFARSAAGVLAPRAALAFPNALASHHANVIGLDGTPPAHTYSHFFPIPGNVMPHNGNGATGPYYPIDLKQAYQLPSYQDATGKGVKIGIVIDAPVSSSDIKAFFKQLELPALDLTIVKITGGTTSTTDQGESSLDVEQSGATAPGAHVTVYEVPSLGGQDIYDGYVAAVKAKATLVNSSFGLCETELTQSNLSTYDAVFKQGIATGSTFVASSGDHGADSCGVSGESPTYAKLGVSWPAVSPYVLAVGGTNLVTSFTKGSNDSSYVKEEADADIKPNDGGNYWGSGGGYSTMYARPSWQSGYVSKNARGVPDVAGHMGGLGFSGSGCEAKKCSPYDSSDVLLELGKSYYSIGTSASSPDTVGLLALASELAGTPLGDVHPLLYKEAKVAGLFHRGIPGNNGYPTTSGLWDPVLGLGTPDAGYKLVGAKSPAGTPGSSTNP